MRSVCVWPKSARLALVSALAIASTVLPSVLAGTFRNGTSWSVAVDDIRSAIGIARHSRSPEAIPYLRDYATIVHVIMIAALLVLLPKAWRLIEDVIPAMEQSKALTWKSDRARSLAIETMTSMNENLESSERSVLSFVFAGAMTLLGSIGYERYGVFQLFGTDSPDWPHHAYEMWWARPFTGGSYGWIVLAVLGNYLIVWNTRIVFALGWFILKHRQDVQFGIDRQNRDLFYGWNEVRSLYRQYLWILLWFGTGVLGFVLIATGKALPWLTVFIALFMVGLLLTAYVHRVFQKTAASERAKWEADLRSSPRDRMSTTELATFRQAQTDVAGVPSSLVPVQTLVLYVVFTIVPGGVVYISLLRQVLS